MSAPAIIPFDKREGYIWMNGEILPWQDAKVHVLTHGLHYGSSVFEGERAYKGKIFKSREHSERLIASAQIMDMEIPIRSRRSRKPSARSSSSMAAATNMCAPWRSAAPR